DRRFSVRAKATVGAAKKHSFAPWILLLLAFIRQPRHSCGGLAGGALYLHKMQVGRWGREIRLVPVDRRVLQTGDIGRVAVDDQNYFGAHVDLVAFARV